MKSTLADYTIEQLRSELAKREAQELFEKKDKVRRSFYRRVDQAFSSFKDKARFIMGLPEEQQSSMIEQDGVLFILDIETDEELRLRLTREADTYWNYDNWRCRFYEDGKKIQDIGLFGESRSYKENWENLSKETWDLDQARQNLGRNSWHPDDYRM